MQKETNMVAAIKSGTRARKEALKALYSSKKLRNIIFHFIRNNNGSEEEAWDIFHDGIIVLDRKVRQGELGEETCVEKYLFGICRLLWFNNLRKKAKVNLTNEAHILDRECLESPDVLYQESEKKAVLQKLLHKLSDQQRQILNLWSKSYTMEEIAEKQNLSSPQLARKYKYRGQKALQNMVVEEPEWAEELK